MISWVLAARNDGYGGQVAGVDNFTMYRLRLTVESIRSHRPDDEVVVVEWCPPSDSPGVAAFLGGCRARVITVAREAQNWLDADNANSVKLPFYEYVSKHLGACMAHNDQLIFVNPDNVFPARNFNGTMVAPGVIVRGQRQEIARQCARRPVGDVIRDAEAGALAVLREFPLAAGDYFGCHRSDYLAVGGYALMHINWHTDNDLLRRIATGRRVECRYQHYHVAHDFSGTEAPGRAREWRAAPTISSELIADIVAFGVAREEIRP